MSRIVYSCPVCKMLRATTKGKPCFWCEQAAKETEKAREKPKAK